MNKKYAGLDIPAWFDGKDINEAAFCREFLSKNKCSFSVHIFVLVRAFSFVTIKVHKRIYRIQNILKILSWRKL